MTKYEHVANSLYQRILDKEFKITKKLPTEDHLMEQYQVSRNTIRNAIKELIKMGVINPIQGSGMFVREPKRPETVYLSSTRGVTSDHPGKKMINKVLHIEVILANQELAEKMQCEIDTPIYYLIRLRIVDNVPYAIEYTYYNKNIIPYLGKEIAEGSIFQYIKEDLHISFGFADKYITAKKLNKQESEWLQLPENDPAIVVEDNIYLTNGTLFNASTIVYNYQLANFFVAVH